MPKRTLRRRNKPRKRSLGFRARSKSKNGRRVLKNRRKVGRRRLTV